MIKLKTLILLALVEIALAASAVAAVDENEPNGTTPLVETSRQIRSSVLRTRLAALPGDSDDSGKTTLEKRVLQINEIKIPQSRNLQKAVVSVENSPSEPNIVEPNKPQLVAESKSGQISERTLGELAVLAKDPNNIAEPLALAQTLYSAGHLKEAAIFYEIAAGRKTSLGRVLTSDDKAWILLQLAACHRDNPQAAISVLNRLISDYPKSIWTPAAAARCDFLQWYQKDKPRSLLRTRHD